MRVIHLMSTHAFSGAENVACQIMNAFKDDPNYEMIYVSEINENKKCLEDRDINYYELKKFNYQNVKKAIDELKPDIIHAHDIRASIIASIFYRRAKIVSHVHANHENMRRSCLKTILYNGCTKNISKIIWVSQSALDYYIYKKNVLQKSMVVYNVINPDRLYEEISKDNNEYDNFDIIYLGRLSFQKNPQRFIKIISKVVESKNNIKVAMVGNGEYEEEIKKNVIDNNLQDNIKVFGFVENPYKILKSSKILMMTSRYEGTPMCALEAMALGKPIIGTPTDGLKDIMDNNETGFYSDDDDTLIQRIIELLHNEKELEQMSENVARKSKDINDIIKYKQNIERVYKMEM